jgi:gas vesicle protein
MLNEWRESHEVSFPDGFTHIQRPLTSSDTLLPPGIKVDRDDIIQRAQSEWHFVVLSSKLYKVFHDELVDIQDKIKNADQYQNTLWEEMKEMWEKVQKNIFDKTLLREHSQQLREMTNDIFTSLKSMRKDMDGELDRVSREFADKFNGKLDEVEGKIKSGLGLQPLFNDLKRLQQEFKDAQLSRGDRSKIWKRIDLAFKTVKEKRFGEKSTRDSSSLDRLNRRYQGLMSAIDKMEKSIRRDDKDKDFQDDRIANTDGQLEAQIRLAKLKMIDERIHSKNEKLAEMQKTKVELEERIEREKRFLEEQKKQQVRKEEMKEAKESVKQKIADTIHAQADQQDTATLEKAAEAITAEKSGKKKSKNQDTLLGAMSETLGESMTDLGDSISAVASVVADKIEDAFQDMKEDVKEKAEDLKEDIEKLAAGARVKAKAQAEAIKASTKHLKEEAKEKAEALKKELHQVKEEVEEKVDDIKEVIEDKMESFSSESGKEDQNGNQDNSI